MVKLHKETPTFLTALVAVWLALWAPDDDEGSLVNELF